MQQKCITKSEDFSISDISSPLITPELSELDYDRHCEIVSNIYNTLVNDKKRIPLMSELMDIIAEMNWDSIFEVIAGDNVGEEEVFDVMDIANDIFSENYLGSNIDLYLEDILYDLKKSCILDIDMYGINQCMLGDRDMIIANDPQQLLLPKFYKEVMNVFVVDAHYSDHHTRWLYEKR